MRQRAVNRMLQKGRRDGIISDRDEHEKRRSEYRVQAELWKVQVEMVMSL